MIAHIGLLLSGIAPVQKEGNGHAGLGPADRLRHEGHASLRHYTVRRCEDRQEGLARDPTVAQLKDVKGFLASI